MTQGKTLLFLLIFTSFVAVGCDLFTKINQRTKKVCEFVHSGLSDTNVINIQDVLWDTEHDNSWKHLIDTAQSSAKDAREKLKDCSLGQYNCGPEVLLSMIVEINEVFISDMAPEHHDILKDLKSEFIRHSSKVWDKYKSNEGTLIVDETVQHILKSVLALRIFKKKNSYLERGPKVQSQSHLSAAFCTSIAAHTYAEGFQASLGFLNMVEHLLMDGLKERKVWRKYPLRQGDLIPFTKRLAQNEKTSRIMHQDALLTWWKTSLSIKNPYVETSKIHLKTIKDMFQGSRIVGSHDHINVWKSLIGVVVTPGTSKKSIQEKLPRLEHYSNAKKFFKRLLHDADPDNLGILEALYEVLDIFETCYDTTDRESFKFNQDIVNELFMFEEDTFALKKDTLVQRAKYMVMWWMLAQSLAKTILELESHHGMYSEVFEGYGVLHYARYLWHFMDRYQRLKGMKHKNRQDRNSFLLGKHYFIYIGCQLHLQDLITNKSLNLWPMTQNLLGSDSLTKIISLERSKKHTFGVDKHLHTLPFERMRNSKPTQKLLSLNKEKSTSGEGIIIQNQQILPKKRKFSGTGEDKTLNFPRREPSKTRPADPPYDDIEEGEIVERMEYKPSGFSSHFEKGYASESPKIEDKLANGVKIRKVEYISRGQREVLRFPSKEAKSRGERYTGSRIGIDAIAQTKQSIPKSRKFDTKNEVKQLELPERGLSRIISTDSTGIGIEKGNIVDNMDHSTLETSSSSRNVPPNTLPKRDEETNQFFGREKKEHIPSDNRELLQSHYKETYGIREGNHELRDLKFNGANHHNSMSIDTKNSDDVLPSLELRNHLIEDTKRQLSPPEKLSELFQELFREESPKAPSFTKDLQGGKKVSGMNSNDVSDHWAENEQNGTDALGMSSVNDHYSRLSPKHRKYSIINVEGMQQIVEKDDTQNILPIRRTTKTEATDASSLHIPGEHNLIKSSPPQLISSINCKGKGKEIKMRIPPRDNLYVTDSMSSEENVFKKGGEEAKGDSIACSPSRMVSSTTQVQNQNNSLQSLQSGTKIEKDKHSPSEEEPSINTGDIAIEDLPTNFPFRLFGVDILPGAHNN
ncbi:secreted protein [Melampsora americana]|nr:secreted protein [Melampsora americana]